MSMIKDIAKLKQFAEITEQYLEASSTILGEVYEEQMKVALLPPLRVLKFYVGKLREMVSRNEPTRASIGDSGDMYTVPDNIVSIQSGKKRAERWNDKGTVRLIEVE